MEKYTLPKAGDRIILIEMKDDPDPVPSGTEGTVNFVDDLPQIHVDWDNGRTLTVIPGVDQYMIKQDESIVKNFEKFHGLITETGEWPNYIDLEYAEGVIEGSYVLLSKEIEDCSKWIISMRDTINLMKESLNDDVRLEIKDIKGFDMYQGPYAILEINGDQFKMWYSEDPEFYIEDFPVNMMDENEKPGLKGDVWELVRSINIVYSADKMKNLNE